MDGTTIRQRFDALWAQRKNLDDIFQVIEKFVVPYRGEFFKPMTSDLEVEWRRRYIYDSTAPVSCDLLASKIHTNLTSPNIRWFELRFRKDEVNDLNDAKEWLDLVQNQIWQTLTESDFSMEIAETYLDLCSFGTAILFEEELDEDEWKGITFTAIPVRDAYFEHGSDDNLLRVYRRLQYTRLQLEDKFPDYDFENLQSSESSPSADIDEKHDVIFCVYEREDSPEEVTTRMAPEKRPFGYKYVMHDSSDEIEEGGYYEMPAFVSRWKKVSGTMWGHSPAFICLSDILQLNEVVAQTSEARSKEIDPPMKTTERGIMSDLDLNPGGLTTVTSMDELERLLDPNPFAFSDVEIARLQENIRNTYFVDKLELKESPAMTATEVLARLQQMMEQFAPTLGRLQADLLDPMIEMTYRVLERNGQLPELPAGLEAENMDIEYTGPIPRAQKNEQAQGISMWIGELAGLAQVIPQILDVVNDENVARELGTDRGVPAKLMRDEAEVKQLREARAEQMAAQAKAQEMESVGKVVKDLSAAAPQEAA